MKIASLPLRLNATYGEWDLDPKIRQALKIREGAKGISSEARESSGATEPLLCVIVPVPKERIQV